MFHEHNRLFEAYLAPQTEHNWMQIHRKVTYVGALSPLKRLFYAKKKAERKKKKAEWILPYISLVDESNESCTGARRTEACVAP